MTESRCVLDLRSDSVFIQENRESLRLTIGRNKQGESRHVEMQFAEARILAYELLASAQRAEYELEIKKMIEEGINNSPFSE